MKNSLVLVLAVVLSIFSSASIIAGEKLDSKPATVVVTNRVCRLQVVVRHGQLLVIDRLTGRFVRSHSGRLIRVVDLRRNNQNVVFLNNNRVVISAFLTNHLLQNRIVQIRY